MAVGIGSMPRVGLTNRPKPAFRSRHKPAALTSLLCVHRPFLWDKAETPRAWKTGVSKFGGIKVGMPAIVKPNEPITGTYEGTVKVVDSVFDAASSTFGVRVELSNTGQKLPAGHRCRVSFDSTTD